MNMVESCIQQCRREIGNRQQAIRRRERQLAGELSMPKTVSKTEVLRRLRFDRRQLKQEKEQLQSWVKERNVAVENKKRATRHRPASDPVFDACLKADVEEAVRLGRKLEDYFSGSDLRKARKMVKEMTR
jgi:hypothetical protein